MNDATSTALIETRGAFVDHLRAGFDEAAREGVRGLHLVDADFATWPLGERAVVERLTQWAASHRRLTVLAAHFDVVVRLHPRWVEWRRQWAHVVDCRVNTEVEPARIPTLFIAIDRFSIRLVEPPRFRGRLSRDPADLQRDQASLDAVLQQSQPALPATVTGL